MVPVGGRENNNVAVGQGSRIPLFQKTRAPGFDPSPYAFVFHDLPCYFVNAARRMLELTSQGHELQTRSKA